ncbi:unnamed protein product [Musa textilis]
MTGGVVLAVALALLLCGASEAWTGEIRGRVVCDVCGDASVGPEDLVLQGRCLLSSLSSSCEQQHVRFFLFLISSVTLLCSHIYVHARRTSILSLTKLIFYCHPLNLIHFPHAFQLMHSMYDETELNLKVFLSGAEVAVLCITESGDVLNYQAFTNSKGIYQVAETMPESDRWVSCLARPVSSLHEHCTRRGDAHSGIKFSYNRPSGHSHTVKPFLYKPASAPLYCS